MFRILYIVKNTKISVFIIMTITCMLPLPLSGQSKPVLAIMDFAGRGISDYTNKLIVDLLSYSLYEGGKYFVIDRYERNKKIKGFGISPTILKNENAYLEIGELLNADFIVRGSVIQSSGMIELNLILFDVKNYISVSAITLTYSSLDELFQDSRQIAERLSPEYSPKTIEKNLPETIVQSLAPHKIKERILVILPKVCTADYEAKSRTFVNLLCQNLIKSNRITIFFTELDYDLYIPDITQFQTLCRKRDCHSFLFCGFESDQGLLLLYNENLTKKLSLSFSLIIDLEGEAEKCAEEFEAKLPQLPVYLLVREIERTLVIQEKLDTLLINEQFLSQPLLINIHRKIFKEVVVNTYHPNLNIISLEGDCLWYYLKLIGVGLGYGYSLGYPATIDSFLSSHPLVSQHELRCIPFSMRTAGHIGIMLHLFVSLNMHNAYKIVDLRNGSYDYINEKLLFFLKTGINMGLLFNISRTSAFFVDMATLSIASLINQKGISFEGSIISGSLGGLGIIYRF